MTRADFEALLVQRTDLEDLHERWCREADVMRDSYSELRRDEVYRDLERLNELIESELEAEQGADACRCRFDELLAELDRLEQIHADRCRLADVFRDAYSEARRDAAWAELQRVQEQVEAELEAERKQEG